MKDLVSNTGSKYNQEHTKRPRKRKCVSVRMRGCADIERLAPFPPSDRDDDQGDAIAGMILEAILDDLHQQIAEWVIGFIAENDPKRLDVLRLVLENGRYGREESVRWLMHSRRYSHATALRTYLREISVLTNRIRAELDLLS